MPQTFWDERFSEEGFVYGTEPNAFLVEQAGCLAPAARVLVPGDGEGRNGVWLAGRGFNVLSVDASAVGIGKAKRLAAERGVDIATEVADLATWKWPVAAFDGVVAVFLHLPPAIRPIVHHCIVAALKPGGIVILEAFRPEQLVYGTGGPKDPAMLYEPRQLMSDFAGTEPLLLEETLIDLDEGKFHSGRAATVRLVARKR